MKLTLRLLTGFMLVVAYRVVLECLKPFASELSSIGGDSLIIRISPLLVAAAIVLFGLVATLIVHQIDKIGGGSVR